MVNRMRVGPLRSSNTHRPPVLMSMMGCGDSCHLTQSSMGACGTESEGSSNGGTGGPPNTMRKLRCMLKKATVGTGQIRHIFSLCTFEIGARGYTNLIVMCQKTSEWKKAVEIFDTMRDTTIGGVRPNIFSYTSLVGVCCASGVPEKAIEVMKDMMAIAASGLDKSLEPDITIYEKIIKACARSGQYKLVLEVYWVMLRKKIVLSQCILEAVFQACIHLTKLKDALERLQDLYLQYTVDSNMCTAFLEAAARNESYDFVLDAFLTIQLWEVEVNSEMCEAVMHSIERAGEPEDGIHLLNQMYTASISPTAKTYNALLWTLAAGGQCSQCLEVSEVMKQWKVTITREGCEAVLKACWNAGNIQLYSALMEEFANLSLYQGKHPTNRRPRNIWRNGNDQNLSFNSSSFGSGFMTGSGSSRDHSSEWFSGADTPSPTAMHYWENEAYRYA